VKALLFALGLVSLLTLEVSYSIAISSYAIGGKSRDYFAGPFATSIKQLKTLAVTRHY
jgi:hypothetical protein